MNSSDDGVRTSEGSDHPAYCFEVPPLGFSDYLRMQRLLAAGWRQSERQSRRSGYLWALGFGVTLGALVLGWQFLFPEFSIAIVVLWSEDSIVMRWPLVLAPAAFMLLLGMALFSWLSWRQQMRILRWVHETSHAFRTGYDLQMLEHEIVSRSRLGVRTTPWGLVTRLARSGDNWFLIVDDVACYWIPDSLVREKPGFHTFVERQISSAKLDSGEPDADRQP